MLITNCLSNADSAWVKHISDIKLMLKNVSSQEELGKNQEEASYA